MDGASRLFVVREKGGRVVCWVKAASERSAAERFEHAWTHCVASSIAADHAIAPAGDEDLEGVPDLGEWFAVERLTKFRVPIRWLGLEYTLGVAKCAASYVPEIDQGAHRLEIVLLKEPGASRPSPGALQEGVNRLVAGVDPRLWWYVDVVDEHELDVSETANRRRLPAPQRRGIVLERTPDMDTAMENARYGMQNGPVTAMWIDASTLRGADFSGKTLRSLRLADAAPDRDLADAAFREGKLILVHLDNADLSRADFSRASLELTSLSRSKLHGVSFRGATLSSVDLRGARIADTSFEGCRGLESCSGLDELVFDGPIHVDPHTIEEGLAKLPDGFLSSLGWSRDAILEARLRRGPLPALRTCFLSYSRRDGHFAETLRRRLEALGAACWRDVDDLVGGDSWREQVARQIARTEAVILVCSHAALESREVVAELEMATARERAEGVRLLVPVCLDGWITSPDADVLSRERREAGLWQLDWVDHVRARHVVDFEGWGIAEHLDHAMLKLGKALARK